MTRVTEAVYIQSILNGPGIGAWRERRWYRRLNQMAMRLIARVVRTDEQLAVLLPSRAVRAIGVRAGDVVELTASNGAIIIRRARRSLSLRELVRRITPENRHDEIRWSPNTDREAW